MLMQIWQALAIVNVDIIGYYVIIPVGYYIIILDYYFILSLYYCNVTFLHIYIYIYMFESILSFHVRHEESDYVRRGVSPGVLRQEHIVIYNIMKIIIYNKINSYFIY